MRKVIVVGGHARNIGKTQLAAEIVRAFAERGWLAVKVTQAPRGVCPLNGASCGCAEDEHTVAVDVETDAAPGIDTGTDTARFLAAGAKRVLWVRAKQGRLAEAIPRLREEMAQAENVILESNTVLEFLQPDLYLSVLDFAVDDFKDSARTMLDRADAYVVVESAASVSLLNVDQHAEPPGTCETHTEPPGPRPGENGGHLTGRQVPPGSAQGARNSSRRTSDTTDTPIRPEVADAPEPLWRRREVLGICRTPDWEGVSLKWLAERPVFRVSRGRMCTGELAEFIRSKLFARETAGAS